MFAFWLVIHVLAAIAGVGPEIAFGLMGPRARRRDRVTASAVYGAIAEVRHRVVYPALVVQVGSGTALVLLGRHSILGERWLGLALLLYAIAIAFVAFVLAPGSARARRALAEGVEPMDERLRPSWRRQAVAGGLAGSSLIVVAILMVWKPGI